MMKRKEFVHKQIEAVDGPVSHRPDSKHAKMRQSPFVFFRGTAALFYADLASGLIALPEPITQLPRVCVMGDCHVSNFGFLTEEGSHGDTVIFAPNDFDDACVGYAGWDIFRLMVSMLLTAQHCQGVVSGTYTDADINPAKPAITLDDAKSALQACLTAYTATCDRVVHRPGEIYQAIDYPPPGKLTKLFEKARQRAALGEAFTSKSALAKAVHFVNDKLQFKALPNKFTRLTSQQYTALEAGFAPYMDDTVIDIVARKNAGTGSLNMARYYFLIGPPHPHDAQAFARCHVVEVKQQRQAAPLAFFPDISPVNTLNPAHLTARCQRKMQRRPDLLLDEVVWQDAHWLIRSRHHAKVGLDPKDLGSGKKAVAGGFVAFARYCGNALALAHCRADRRSVQFAKSASHTLRAQRNALCGEAERYFRQVLEDYQGFRDSATDSSEPV